VVDENNQDVATARISEHGEIGRIAIEPQHRGPEVYQLLFNALIRIAKQHGLHSVNISCELEGVNHYQQQGFQPIGPCLWMLE
jgi:predicted GNAT family N-acyltransferase